MLENNKIELSISPNKISLTEIDFQDLTSDEKEEYNKVIALPESDLITMTLENISDYEN